MTNKQGQPGQAGNKKQEGQGNQGFQEDSKRGGQKAQPGQGREPQKGPLPGSQRDPKGRIGQ